MSLGTDFGSALEVNPNPDAVESDAASASDDREPAGNTADDRKELNRASEALKTSRELKGQVAQLSTMVMSLLERQNGNGQPTPEAPKPAPEPYDRDALKAALANGDMDGFSDMLDAVLKHRVEQGVTQATNQAVSRVDQNLQARDARSFLVKELGLANTDREENREILKVANQLQRDYPTLWGSDSAGAQLAASGIVYRRALRGEIDFPDLRAETLDRTKNPPGVTAVGPAETEGPAIKPDWNAKNRGLPADMAQQLRSWGLGNLLSKSNDPHEERVARETIQGFLDDGTHGG